MIALGAGDVKAGTVFTFSSAFPLVTAQSPRPRGCQGVVSKGDLSSYPLWFPFSFRYSLGVTPVCFLNM